MSRTSIEAAAAAEFDTWAQGGDAERMALGHRAGTQAATAPWALSQAHTVLDVGCGNGWAVRWMVERGAGRGLGFDVSADMIGLAQAATKDDPRFRFAVGSAAQLPLPDAHVSHVLSVEMIYYTASPAAALAEWHRVTQPGGQLALMIDLYRANPVADRWCELLPIQAHNLSQADYVRLLQQAGWQNVQASRALDTRPVKTEAEFEPSDWWPTYADYTTFRAAGSLVLNAQR